MTRARVSPISSASSLIADSAVTEKRVHRVRQREHPSPREAWASSAPATEGLRASALPRLPRTKGISTTAFMPPRESRPRHGTRSEARHDFSSTHLGDERADHARAILNSQPRPESIEVADDAGHPLGVGTESIEAGELSRDLSARAFLLRQPRSDLLEPAFEVFPPPAKLRRSRRRSATRPQTMRATSAGSSLLDEQCLPRGVHPSRDLGGQLGGEARVEADLAKLRHDEVVDRPRGDRSRTNRLASPACRGSGSGSNGTRASLNADAGSARPRMRRIGGVREGGTRAAPSSSCEPRCVRAGPPRGQTSRDRRSARAAHRTSPRHQRATGVQRIPEDAKGVPSTPGACASPSLRRSSALTQLVEDPHDRPVSMYGWNISPHDHGLELVYGSLPSARSPGTERSPPVHFPFRRAARIILSPRALGDHLARTPRSS